MATELYAAEATLTLGSVGEMCACSGRHPAPTITDLCVCGVACKLFNRPVGIYEVLLHHYMHISQVFSRLVGIQGPVASVQTYQSTLCRPVDIQSLVASLHTSQ